MMDILGLLKQLATDGECGTCPRCGGSYGCGETCELKSAIDALASGRMVMVEIGKPYMTEMDISNGNITKIEPRKKW